MGGCLEASAHAARAIAMARIDQPQPNFRAWPHEDASPDWLAAGSAVPFTSVAEYMPEAAERWQELFEHSFARELSCRPESVEAFLSELQCASS